MKGKVKVGIIGATGYTGIELCKIISRHPNTKIVFLTSQTYADKRIHQVFPELKGICEHRLIPLEDGVERRADIVFSCLPHAKSAETCINFLEKRTKVIDLSADFRLNSASKYKQWYKNTHPNPDFLKTAVFGLPELYRSAIKKARLVANPGCFTTSALLPLLPLIKAKAIDLKSIIIDSKTGVSGAGRTTKRVETIFSEANENITPYNVGQNHRHYPEIHQELSKMAKSKDINILFSPHLVPLTRGMLSTIYVDLKKPSFAKKIEDIYSSFFKNSFGIRLTGENLPSVRSVANTSFCDIGWQTVPGTNKMIVVSAIDNLLRGASGMAVQNMNLILGIKESTGLE